MKQKQKEEMPQGLNSEVQGSSFRQVIRRKEQSKNKALQAQVLLGSQEFLEKLRRRAQGAVSEAIRRFRKRVISGPSIADIVDRACRSLKIYT